MFPRFQNILQTNKWKTRNLLFKKSSYFKNIFSKNYFSKKITKKTILKVVAKWAHDILKLFYPCILHSSYYSIKQNNVYRYLNQF